MNNKFDSELMFPHKRYIIRIMTTLSCTICGMLRVMPSGSVQHSLNHHQKKDDKESSDLGNWELLQIQPVQSFGRWMQIRDTRYVSIEKEVQGEDH